MIIEERRNVLYFLKASEGHWITQKGSVTLSARQFAKEICITSPDMIEEFGEITDEEYRACLDVIDSQKTEAELLDEEVSTEEVMEFINSLLDNNDKKRV